MKFDGRLQKQYRKPLLCHCKSVHHNVATCEFIMELQSRTSQRKIGGKICFDVCDIDICPLTLTCCYGQTDGREDKSALKSFLVIVKKQVLYGDVWTGSRFNIKMTSYQYKKSHCGDKTILRPSYLHNGISYTRKMTSLYWIRALVIYWEYTWYGSVNPLDLNFAMRWYYVIISLLAGLPIPYNTITFGSSQCWEGGFSEAVAIALQSLHPIKLICAPSDTSL